MGGLGYAFLLCMNTNVLVLSPALLLGLSRIYRWGVNWAGSNLRLACHDVFRFLFFHVSKLPNLIIPRVIKSPSHQIRQGLDSRFCSLPNLLHNLDSRLSLFNESHASTTTRVSPVYSPSGKSKTYAQVRVILMASSSV